MWRMVSTSLLINRWQRIYEMVVIDPATKPAQPRTSRIIGWSWLQNAFDQVKRFIKDRRTAVQDHASRWFWWAATKFRVAPLLSRLQRQPLQSKLDHGGNSARRAAKVKKDPTRKKNQKSETPGPDQCTWLQVSQLVAQGNVRPCVQRKVSLKCREVADQVDHIFCSINTTDR